MHWLGPLTIVIALLLGVAVVAHSKQKDIHGDYP